MPQLAAGKGLNRDQPPFELELGMWSDLVNVRSIDGVEQTVGGVASIHTPTITPYWLGLFQTSTARFIVEAGTTKVYAYNGTTETEITRVVVPVAVTTFERMTNVITVTTGSAHSLTTGDIVYTVAPGSITGADGEQTITVTGATTYTYANTGANTGAVAGGSYKVVNSASVVNFTGAQDDRWSGGNLNGVWIMSNPADGLYSWNGSTSRKLTPLYGGAASTTRIGYVADVSRVFRDFIIQLAPTISSVKYPYRVVWSTLAEPGSLPTSFTAATTNLAGDVDKTGSGQLVDCLDWGGMNYIYGPTGYVRQRYIPNSNDVFEFTPAGTQGLLARGCVVNTPKGQVFLTPEKDVRIHQGGESVSIAQGRVKNWLKSNINTTYEARSFLCVNAQFNEVWIVFPATGQTACNRALIWNWETDTWGDRSLSGMLYAVDGMVPTGVSTSRSMVLSTSAPKVGLVDSGTTDLGSAISYTFERVGMHGGDRNSMKMFHTSRPVLDAPNATTATVYHGSSSTPDGTVTYDTGQTFTHNTTIQIDGFPDVGRYMAWKMTGTGTGQEKLRSVDVEFSISGKY